MSDSNENSSEHLAAIALCTQADFDGHTDFRKLTPSQKLDALASMARFVHEFKGLAAKNRAESAKSLRLN